MTNTAQEIREAFAPIAGQPDTSRLTIIDEHPRASDAHRMIDALGDRYGKQLSVLEWCYIAVPVCLQFTAESSPNYPDDPTPEQIRENAYEWADSLTDVYNHDLRAWAHEHPAVFEDGLDIVCDYHITISDSTDYYKMLMAVQSQAYAAAFDTIASEWPEPEEDPDDEEETDDAGTIAAVMYPFCTQCTRVIYRDQQPTGDVCNACQSRQS